MNDQSKILYILSIPRLCLETYKKQNPDKINVMIYTTPRGCNVRSDVRAMVHTAKALNIEKVHFIVDSNLHDYDNFMLNLEFELQYIANVINLDITLSFETDDYKNDL